MINQLEIENFQSHKKTEFEFVPGINVITGPSDVGKSTIIRSMYSVVANKPSGDAYRRHGSKKTAVTLNGSVTKVRTGSDHRYELNGNTYKALRTSVPQEITDHLRLTSDNFQGQHDTFFLISDSPGQVAKTLNQVADLQIIDLSLQAVKQKVREAKSNKKFYEEEFKKQEEKVEDLQWVKELDKDYKVYEQLQSKADAIDYSQLESQLDLIQTLQEEVDSLPDTTIDRGLLTSAEQEISIDYSYLEGLLTTIEANQVDIPDSSEDQKLIREAINQLDIDISGLESVVEAAEEALEDYNWYPETIDDLSGEIESLQTMDDRLQSVNNLVDCCLTAQKREEGAIANYEKKKEDYEVRLRELEICPVCGGSTT